MAVVVGMSMAANEENVGRLGDEPTCGIMYLSDGVGPHAEIVGTQRDNVAAAGERFLRATGGDACLLLAGPLVSEAGRDDQSTEGAVARCCVARFGYPGDPLDGTIDLILDTFGGSLDAAFKTMLFVSRFAKRLRVFVPRRAKSAGTLIAIGADELCMSPFAELGPLDTQIRDPRNPTDRVSALDCYQSVDYVRAFGLSTLSKTFRALAGETRTLIPLPQLVNTSADFSIGSISPILTQVNALDFGGWGRTLRIGELYAQTLLSRVGYSEEESRAIAYQLVYGYTHHPFPIDLNEARRVGLKPSGMTEEQYESALDIVTACAQPGVVVVGFADEKSGEPAGQVTQGPDGVPADQAAKAVAQVTHRSPAGTVAGDGGRGAVAWIEEGERPARAQGERAPGKGDPG
jgi:Serine dehydrogenase proteinase